MIWTDDARFLSAVEAVPERLGRDHPTATRGERRRVALARVIRQAVRTDSGHAVILDKTTQAIEDIAPPAHGVVSATSLTCAVKIT
jgi:ABC-type hemin transport system ATPase subunit